MFEPNFLENPCVETTLQGFLEVHFIYQNIIGEVIM